MKKKRVLSLWVIKKIKKNSFCETEKSDYPRFLGHFYYHGTIDLPCISKPTSIRNWVTFCVSRISSDKIEISSDYGYTLLSYTQPWKKGGDLWRQVRKQFGKNDREWFFASSIENREREVDIVANVGLVAEFHKYGCLCRPIFLPFCCGTGQIKP